MIIPGSLDIRALRWQQFKYSWLYIGANISASAFKMQVRPVLDSAVAFADLANVAVGVQGISRVATNVDGVWQTEIIAQIDKVTMGAFPEPLPAGEPEWAGVYDLKIDDIVWVRGAFIVEGGSTR